MDWNDWKDEFPPATGIDKFVGAAAQRLMRGPLVFKSPYWDGEVKIESLDDYRAWIRTVDRMGNELGAEHKAEEIWDCEKKKRKENV